MTVIQFESRRLHAENNSEEQAQAKASEDGSSFPKNSQVSYLRAKKIIHFSRFLQLKQNQNKDKENTKLRDGLVLKIHALRKEIEEALTVNGAPEGVLVEILEMASDCADSVLYDEISTVDLLNKYWVFKKSVKELCKKYIADCASLIQI